MQKLFYFLFILAATPGIVPSSMYVLNVGWEKFLVSTIPLFWKLNLTKMGVVHKEGSQIKEQLLMSYDYLTATGSTDL